MKAGTLIASGLAAAVVGIVWSTRRTDPTKGGGVGGDEEFGSSGGGDLGTARCVAGACSLRDQPLESSPSRALREGSYVRVLMKRADGWSYVRHPDKSIRGSRIQVGWIRSSNLVRSSGVPVSSETSTAPPVVTVCDDGSCGHPRARLQVGAGGVLGSFDPGGAFLPILAGLREDLSDPGDLTYFAGRYPKVVTYPRDSEERIAGLGPLEKQAWLAAHEMQGYCVPPTEPRLRRVAVSSASGAAMRAYGPLQGPSSLIPPGACLMAFDTTVDNRLTFIRSVYFAPDASVHAGWVNTSDLRLA